MEIPPNPFRDFHFWKVRIRANLAVCKRVCEHFLLLWQPVRSKPCALHSVANFWCILPCPQQLLAWNLATMKHPVFLGFFFFFWYSEQSQLFFLPSAQGIYSCGNMGRLSILPGGCLSQSEVQKFYSTSDVVSSKEPILIPIVLASEELRWMGPTLHPQICPNPPLTPNNPFCKCFPKMVSSRVWVTHRQSLASGSYSWSRQCLSLACKCGYFTKKSFYL